MRIDFQNLKVLNLRYADQIKKRINDVVDSGVYLLGQELRRFEDNFARSVEADFCVGVNSGLDALRLILKALGVGPGDEVLVSGHTFFATWLAIIETGATLVPVDLAQNELNITLDSVKPLLTDKTRGLVAVHMYGAPCDIAALETWCSNQGLFLVEDAAQAHGASCDGRMVGSFGDAAAWSFYPAKNLGSLGNGGAVTTRNETLANQIRSLRNYGSSERYVYEMLGMNSRLDEFQAAALDCKLPYLAEENVVRKDIADQYFERLKSVSGLVLPHVLAREGFDAVWHQFPVLTRSRRALQQFLSARGVSTLIHYPVANHRQPALKQLPYLFDLCLPGCERVAHEVLSLPVSPEHERDEIDRVCDVIIEYFT